MVRKNKDGSISVGILEDEKPVVKEPEKEPAKENKKDKPAKAGKK